MKLFIISLLMVLGFAPTCLGLMCHQCHGNHGIRGYCSIDQIVFAKPDAEECPDDHVCYFADFKDANGVHIIYEDCVRIPPASEKLQVNKCMYGDNFLGHGKFCMCNKNNFCMIELKSGSSTRRLSLSLAVACFISGILSA